MCAYLVITPAHNEETLLPNLIDSLAGQVIKPKRWILIDDGSEDRTPDIVDEAASQISWIKACHLFGLRWHDAGARLLMMQERLSIAMADRVMAMNDLQRQRLSSAGPRDKKLRTVMNTPDPAIFRRTSECQSSD